MAKQIDGTHWDVFAEKIKDDWTKQMNGTIHTQTGGSKMHNRTKRIKQVLGNGKVVYWWLKHSGCSGSDSIQLMFKNKDNEQNFALELGSDGTIMRYELDNTIDFGFFLNKHGEIKIRKIRKD